MKIVMNKVIVLMSTFNGEKYLKEQIDSILAQQGVEIHILVRDDGSTDSTQSILKTYSDEGKLKWYSGKNLRTAKSFMDLLRQSGECEYYAFSDQDDFWLPEKLITAINILKKQDENRPALYYGQTTLVDANLNIMKQKQEYHSFTIFRNAVVSSNATGCTFCFNKKLRDMINLYIPSYQIMHDGWLHKVCLAIDGYVYFDRNSYIYYRQHENNVIGGTTTPLKRWKRRFNMVRKNPCPRSRGISEILKGYKLYMSEENRRICEEIAEYKNSPLKKMRLFFDNSISSPNKKINTIYKLAVLLGLF